MIVLSERVHGLLLLSGAAVLLLSALLIGNGAINRWRAVVAVQSYHLAHLGSHDGEAGEHATAAAALLPDDAATALAAIDPAAPNATDELDLLARRVPARQRSLVQATMAFAAVLAGKAAENTIEGADATLLKHLAQLGRGEQAAFPILSQGDAPSMAIYSRTAQAHAQAAWNAGKADALRSSLAVLALLRPQHHEIAEIRAVLAAVTPECDKVRVLEAVSQINTNPTAWARRLAVLVPARAPLFLGLIPANQRSSEELQQLNLGGVDGETLQAAVERAITAPGDAVMVATFLRCVQENQLDLAAKLVDKAPAGIKRDLQIALAYQRGDFLTLATIDPKRTDLKPQNTAPIRQAGRLSFHLASLTGLTPQVGGLNLRIDGKPVAPERIKRWGSLVMVDHPGAGDLQLEVKMGDTLISAGPVKSSGGGR